MRKGTIMNKQIFIRIFITLSLLFSISAQAVEAPALSAEAKKLLDQVNKRISNINTNEFMALLKPQAKTVVIDVRNPEELTLNGGYIRAENYFNIPRGQLELRISIFVFSKDTPIVVYDDFNQRSPLAADALSRLGYTNVKNYADGFYKWK